MLRIVLALAAALLSGAAGEAAHAARPGDMCWAAIDKAAESYQAPRALMRAMGLVESGRGSGAKRAPWPWTINIAGKSKYFKSKSQAIGFAKAALARGERSFDVGCLQINYRWHAEAFTDLEEMFDPAANADYAARFLTELKEETGDWLKASGYYHSRTPKFFKRYKNRVMTTLAEMTPGSPDAPAIRTAVAERPKPPQPKPVAAPAAPKEAERPAEVFRVAALEQPTVAPRPIEPPRKSPLRPAVWRGLLRQAAGALLRPTASASSAAAPPPGSNRSGEGAFSTSRRPGGVALTLMRPAAPPAVSAE